MARRKRYVKGRVFITNDAVLTKSAPKKRRVVVTNNNPKKARVRRVLSAGKGRNSQKGTPIEKYPDIRKESVVESRTFTQSINGQPLDTTRMRKTKTRLNKWDRKKLGIK